MDRFNPPNLFIPSMTALISGILFALAYRMPGEGGAGVVRGLFVTIAVILAGIAFFTGMDWLVYRAGVGLKLLRESYYGPQLKLAEAIRDMRPDQLVMLGYYSPFRAEARMSGGNLQWWLHTPRGDIPYGWVGEYLEKCALGYPKLIPQHGMPDALNRDYTQWFTELMVSNGLATPAAGNQAATWKVPLDDVYKRLGWEEGE